MKKAETYYGTGGIESPSDSRDFAWEKIGYATTPFNWSVGFSTKLPLKVKDQNGSFSCGGQALAYYGEILNGKADGVQEERSAKYIYAPVAVSGGGSTGRDLMDRVVKNGWGREKLTPSYENGLPPSEAFMTKKQDITMEAILEASDEKALSYVKINYPEYIENIAQAIRDNNGVLLGLDGANNGTWTTAFPQSPIMNVEWRHWVFAFAAKKINDTRYIGIINSWGRHVGDNGVQWIGEEYFESGHCFEAWTCVYNTKPLNGFKYRFNNNLEVGMRGDDVKALQAVLRLEGLFKYPIDTGEYGLQTQMAVYAFQKKYNISPLSRWLYKGFYCGNATRAKLNELYSP